MKNDPNKRKKDVAMYGGGAALAGAGGLGLVASRKKSVGIPYGFDPSYPAQGHKSQAKDLQRLLKEKGVESELYGPERGAAAALSHHPVKIYTHWGPNILGGKELPFDADY